MKNYIKVAIIFPLLIVNLTYAGNLKGKVKFDGEVLRDVVVYLEPVVNVKFAAPKEEAIMDQKNLNFVPHVLPVLLGTKVVFPNSDQMRHSVFSTSKIKKFDFGTYKPGTEKSIICDQAGVIPVLCYIHHDMSAYIVVLETPYFDVTNESGEYSIKNIPPGKYRLSFWHEENAIKTEEIDIPDHDAVKNISAEE